MKQILSIVSIATVMVACNNNSDVAALDAKLQAYKDSVKMAADTAGLAHFQNWKAQNELADVSEYNNATTNAQYAAVAPVAAPVRKASPARATTSNRTASSGNSTAESGTMSSESSNAAMRKKGWSKAAKGATIGAGSGAVLGAVINKKNRVLGGVVGGVIGGGVGYGIGRGMDKKDGRY